MTTLENRDEILSEFRQTLEAWRAAHPGWTEGEQQAAFSPHSLWRLAGGTVDPTTSDRLLYIDLMEAAGYIVRGGS